MKLLIHSLALASLLACSAPGLRLPASAPKEVVLGEILDFSSWQGNFAGNSYPLNKNYLRELQAQLGILRNVQTNVAVNLEVDSTLQSAFRVAFKMDGQTQQLKLVIVAQQNFATQHAAQAELRFFLAELFNEATFNTVYDVFETGLNAELGDISAHQNLLQVRQRALQRMLDMKVIGQDDFERRLGEIAPYQRRAQELALARQKLIRAEGKARKEILSALDKVSEMEQLRPLVAAGKRGEVAELIRRYLPWEKMLPMERLFWEENLKYMAQPLPLEERMLVFRGIDGDMTYPAIVDGKLLDRVAAEESGEVFLMSSLLTKNQGTWNRRLRSLETMQEKVISQNAKTHKSNFTRSSRISTMMYQHSLNPAGSPFLSYTPKINTAENFGKTRMSALLLDPRITYANFASAYGSEVEYLSTLITFPDEMVAVFDRTRHPDILPSLYFAQQLMRKLSVQYGEEKALKLTQGLFKETKSLAQQGSVHAIQSHAVASQLGAKKPGVFSQVIATIKGLFVKGQAPLPPISSEVLQPPEQLSNCTNIIQLFFTHSANVGL